MRDLVDLFVRAALVENLALTFFLGMCTFLAVSQRLRTALGLGAAVIVVQTITVPVNHLVHAHLLGPGALAWAGWPELDLSYLELIAAIGVIAAVVQVLELFLRRHGRRLYDALGVYLPLITVNCAILGATLFMVERRYDLAQSAVYGFGSGCGWALALVLLAGLREKMATSDVPRGLRGVGIAFVVAGLLSLAFLGFAGLRWG